MDEVWLWLGGCVNNACSLKPPDVPLFACLTARPDNTTHHCHRNHLENRELRRSEEILCWKATKPECLSYCIIFLSLSRWEWNYSMVKKLRGGRNHNIGLQKVHKRWSCATSVQVGDSDCLINAKWKAIDPHIRESISFWFSVCKYKL